MKNGRKGDTEHMSEYQLVLTHRWNTTEVREDVFVCLLVFIRTGLVFPLESDDFGGERVTVLPVKVW